MELLHNLQHCLNTFMYLYIYTCTHMLTHTHAHTHITHLLFLLAVCAFSSIVFCWRKPRRFSISLRQGPRGKLLLGKEKSELGVAEAL